MIDGITPAVRTPRAPQAKSAGPVTGAASDATTEQHALARARAAFDLDTEVQAEAERERDALEQLLLAQLKDEDEVMKKWIAMIS
jgi:hypothetical protein